MFYSNSKMSSSVPSSSLGKNNNKARDDSAIKIGETDGDQIELGSEKTSSNGQPSTEQRWRVSKKAKRAWSKV
jgi:hypothetical protein